LTNDEIVEQALTSARHMPEVEIEPTSFDCAEKNTVLKFMENGCGCKLWEKQQCYLQFSTSHYSSL